MFPETLTMVKYDITKPVSIAEDSQACNLAVDAFSIAMQKRLDQNRAKGWGGWNRSSECTNIRLVELLQKAYAEGDVIKIGIYAMMLHARSVKNTRVCEWQQEVGQLADSINDHVILEQQLIEKNLDAITKHQMLVVLRERMEELNERRKDLLTRIQVANV